MNRYPVSTTVGEPRSSNRTYHLVVLLVVLVTHVSVSAAQQAGLKVGDKPPLLEAKTLWQAPQGTKLDANSLRGKLVILEFWATWCGPCVQAIPHLNELADKFKDKPVQFIAITSEDEMTVKAFLKKKPIKAWIVLDIGKSMHKAYGVEPIPLTVVIGKDGTIAAVTNPFDLTEQRLNDSLSPSKMPQNMAAATSGGGGGGWGTSGSMPEEIKKRINDLSVGTNRAPLFQVLVRRSTETNAQYGFGSRGMGFASAGSQSRKSCLEPLAHSLTGF
jgi:thiol-disulfide isomerase/thioredoxin